MPRLVFPVGGDGLLVDVRFLLDGPARQFSLEA